MAIQIPQLRQFEGQTPVESGRLQVNPPDVSPTVSPQREAISNLVNVGVKFAEREMESAANDFANKSAIELKAEFNKGFHTGYSPEDTGLKYKTGPDAFDKQRNNLITKVNEKYNSILNSEGTSDYIKQKARAKLDSVMADVNAELTTWEGKARSDYKAEVVQARVEDLSRSLITVYAPHYDPKKPETIAGINLKIAEIQAELEQEATDNGQVLVDENGKKTYSQVTQIKIAKTLSKSIQNMVENIAYTPGQTEKAKALYNTYSEYIDAFGQEQTKRKIEQLDLENKATNEAQKYLDRGMNAAEIQDAMGKLPTELRKETSKEVARQARERESIFEARSKEMYRPVFEDVFKRNLTEKPYADVQEVIKVHRANWDSLTTTQQATIKKMVERKTFTNPEQLSNMMEAYRLGKFELMSPEAFTELTAGAATTDQRIFLRHWNAANNPAQDVRDTERTKRTLVRDSLTNELVLQGIIPKKGPYSPSQREKIQEYQLNLLKELESYPSGQLPKANSTEAVKLMKENIRKFKSGEAFEDTAPPPPPTPRSKDVNNVGVSQAFDSGRASGAQRKARVEMISKKLLIPGSPNDTFYTVDQYIKEGK